MLLGDLPSRTCDCDFDDILAKSAATVLHSIWDSFHGSADDRYIQLGTSMPLKTAGGVHSIIQGGRLRRRLTPVLGAKSMTPLLTVLNDLSYVIECTALDYLGEGKTELSRLCDRLDSDTSHEIADHTQIAIELREALSFFKSGDKFQGAGRLARVSRKLWALAGT